jgi:hypothetical protein
VPFENTRHFDAEASGCCRKRNVANGQHSNDSNDPNDYRGSRSGISATACAIAAMAAAAFDTSSGAIRSTVSAALW